MRQKFAEYNQKYFGGQLPIPTFNVQNLNGMWGLYDLNGNFDKRSRKITKTYDNGKLILTNAYSRNEKDVISTLLHEMCHEYVNLVMGLYPVDKHGREFMTAAQNLIADGWNMEAETVETDTDVYGGKNENVEESFLCIITKPQGTDYKYWACKATKQNMQQVKSTAMRIQGVQSVKFYVLQNNEILMHVQSNPQTLFGWGGMTVEEMLNNVAKYVGVDISVISQGWRQIA